MALVEPRRLDRPGVEPLCSGACRRGLVQNYALLMLFGVFAFVSVYLFVAGKRCSATEALATHSCIMLSIILFTPLVGALIAACSSASSNENAIRWIANVVALVGFLISIPLWFWFNPQSPDFQFVERAPWIPSIGADYFLGVDGLSAPC